MRKPIAAVVVACMSTVPLYATPVETHGNLSVVGTQLTGEHGNPVVLRGMSFGWHNWWPRFYNAGVVEWLATDWQCTVVRAAMGVEENDGYIERPDWSKERMKEVIDGAIKSGIYVIIDWHSHNINLEEAKGFFAEMARIYGEHPNVIYEIFNEPDRESWDDIKAYSIEVIKAIRAVDPDNLILVGTPEWDQKVHVAADDPVTGYDNLMYTLHFYAATHKEWLRAYGEQALEKGLPLFVSECAGMKSNGDGELDLEEWRSWLNWMEERKISHVTWSVADKNESCSVVLPSANSEGGWTEADLKESGRRTRALLRGFASAD